MRCYEFKSAGVLNSACSKFVVDLPILLSYKEFIELSAFVTGRGESVIESARMDLLLFQLTVLKG